MVQQNLCFNSSSENISLYGDGSVRRTLTYIDDLCTTIIKCAFSDRCVNDIYNIGGEDYSLREMAELIALKYGVGISFVPWPELALKIESGDTVFDSEKLDSLLEIKRNTTFKEWINGIV